MAVAEVGTRVQGANPSSDKQSPKVLEWLSSTSAIIQRMFLGSKLGMQFGGKRDLYKVYGYPLNLDFTSLYAKYKRQDITKRIVEQPAKGIWTNPPEILANKTFNTAWNEMVDKYDLWTQFNRIDKLLCFGRFAVIYIGLRGDTASPAPKANLDGVLYLQSFGEDRAKVARMVESPTDPRYGRPIMYDLSPVSGGQGVGVQAHFSRCIHFTNELCLDNVYSEPRLEAVYNLLDDLLKVAGGSAETYWLTANRGMQVDVDKEVDLKVEDAEQLSDELEEFQHQLRRYIRTRGVKITPLGSDTPDPSGIFKVLINLISGTTGIPQRILMGAEAGQLASEQDRANWATMIIERRASFAEPCILKPFITQMIDLGILPKPNTEVKYEWPEAFRVSPLEQAQTMAQTARAIVNISRQAQYGHPLVSTEEARVILGLPEKPPIPLPEPTDAIPPTPPAAGGGGQPGEGEGEGEQGQGQGAPGQQQGGQGAPNQ